MSSQERFGYEWAKYSQMDKNYEDQFRNWIFPIQPKDFPGKRILDAGCGMGRNSFWCLKYGASEVAAFDYDQRSIRAAQKNLKEFNNKQILYKSIYDLSWQDEFDMVICMGVIHHLDRPKEALVNLIKALKPGGELIIWVYSFEGNEWIVKYINPIRKTITSKLPLPVVHLISYIFSVPLWLFIKIFKGPTEYLRQLAKFKFWHIQSIVFDQLIPSVANYWTKEEVIDLVKDLNLQQLDLHQPPNNCGWTLMGRKL